MLIYCRWGDHVTCSTTVVLFPSQSVILADNQAHNQPPLGGGGRALQSELATETVGPDAAIASTSPAHPHSSRDGARCECGIL